MAANFEPNAHVQAPRSYTSLSKLKEATTNGYLPSPAGMLPMLTAKQVPTYVSTATSHGWFGRLIGLRRLVGR
jgi:hypothetical protein